MRAFHRLAIVIAGCIPVGVAIKLIATCLGKYTYSPWFPNIIDCLLLMVVGIVLIYFGFVCK